MKALPRNFLIAFNYSYCHSASHIAVQLHRRDIDIRLRQHRCHICHLSRFIPILHYQCRAFTIELRRNSVDRAHFHAPAADRCRNNIELLPGSPFHLQMCRIGMRFRNFLCCKTETEPLLFRHLKAFGDSHIIYRKSQQSCNQSFIQIGARLGKEAFCDYFAAFGLREPTGVDLPAEPKKSLYYTADRMGPVELASCAFGQSSKISYMEMAAAVCAVVNGGRLMQPYLVSDILNPDGSILQHTEPVCRRQVIKPETSETMREMMEAVVLYGGGRNARIQGYRVGGKSGTSQKLDSADEKARIASFVAVAPIDDPQFLCLVCLDEPHSWTTAGGSLSAPVCAEVLEQTLVYKGVPRAVEPETDPDPAQTAADLPADGDSFDGA